MLALPEGDNQESKVFCPFALYVRKIEPAGEAFEKLALKRLVFNDDFNDFKKQSNEKMIIEEDKEVYDWEKEYYESLKSNKQEKLISSIKENYYSILGLDELFINASIDDIRRAYKKQALAYHPDKNKDNNNLLNENDFKEEVFKIEEEKLKLMSEEDKIKFEINKKWLKIKEAYDTLIDPEKRKKYDSTFDFDDEIPDEDITYSNKEFFKAFGPYFLKNSIWSKQKPVPKIGDKNTTLDKVHRFYQFWYNFESWRDFSVDGEYNLEEAGNRYEKRQMLKENKKMKASMMKSEKQRIITLVELAYKNDPRIIEHEENLRIKRENEKKERLEQKKKEKEDEENRYIKMRIEREEKLKKQQEELIEEKENLLLQFKKLLNDNGIILNEDEYFQIQLNATNEILKKSLNELFNLKDKSEFQKTFKSIANTHFAMKYYEESKESYLWNKEEIVNLQKAVKKFPAGCKNRWEKK